MGETNGLADFDQYAANYDDALEKGISVSGESKDYFADGRIAWMNACLQEMDFIPHSMLDFGCGTGTATPHLRTHFPLLESIVGLDVSPRSIDVARRDHASNVAEFHVIAEYLPEESIDLGYCNGVFHHIPLVDRMDAAKFIHSCIGPGGMFAYWENNPWNPGTRYIMSRIPFDKDAVTLTARESQSLLESAGFEVLRVDYRFYFPRCLGVLRFCESAMVKIPLGAQYQVLCRKPSP